MPESIRKITSPPFLCLGGTKMSEDIMEYIKEQSSVLDNVLKYKRNEIEKSIDSINLATVDRILFVGSGSSYNVSLAVKNLYEKLLHKEVLCEYPFTLRNYSHILANDSGKTLVIAISQSGKSTGPIECLKKAKAHGMETLSITYNTDSLITDFSDHVVPLFCGEEKVGAKTKGYTTTLLTLQLIGLYWSQKLNILAEEEADKYYNQLNEMICTIDDTIKKTRLWAKENKHWCDANSMVVVGYGSNLGSAMEGSLKILEMYRKPVLAYDVEEYIHGPYNSLGPDSHMIFLDIYSDVQNSITNLINYVSKITDNYLVVSNNGKGHDQHYIHVAQSYETLSPLTSIIPFQIIGYEMAISLGINPGIPKYTDFHEQMKSKLGLVDFN